MSQPCQCQSSASDQNHASYRAAFRTAIVAGVFTVVVMGLLLADYGRRLAKDPLESPTYKALKAELAKQPRNETLKTQIRDLDLQLRRSYFRQRAFATAGAWLLLAGAVVSLVAIKAMGTIRRRLPRPALLPVHVDTYSRVARTARWAVAVTAVVLALAAVGLSRTFRSELPGRADQLALLTAGKNGQGTSPDSSPLTSSPSPTRGEGSRGTGALAAANAKPKPSGAASKPTPTGMHPQPTPTAVAQGDLPTDEEMQANWPRFRGPDGSGVTSHKGIPTTWDVPAGKGVIWKTEVPLPGNSSPVVWKDRVFLTGGTVEKREVYCFSATDGKLLWQQPVAGLPDAAAKLKDIPEEGGAGFASPTAATDGRRVYAIFASGDMAAFDVDGKPVWKRSLGVPRSAYGFAASLLTYRDKLLVQLDQGAAKDKLSKLLAMDATSGRTVWETPREVPNSWSTPILIRVGGQPQIVTAADPWVIAYEPEKGSEIWRVRCLRQDVGPSPAFAGGMVYVASQFPQLSAIRADGKGDVTKSHLAWIGEDGLPDTCSPLATEEYVALLSSDGMLTCYDAKKGDKLWEEEFKDANFASSPSQVGKQMYLFSNEGKSWVIEPSQQGCKRIAEGELGEKCVTSPAFQEGRLYIRGEKNLFCLGGK